jgi:hypothetical protein
MALTDNSEPDVSLDASVCAALTQVSLIAAIAALAPHSQRLLRAIAQART